MVFVAAMAALPVPALATAEEDLAAAQRRANQAAGELNKAQVELAEAEDTIAHLETRVSAVDARVGKSREQLRKLAVRMYTQGTSSLTRILRMADANEVVRAQQFSHVLAATSTDALGDFRAERENLEDEVAALERKKDERTKALDSLQARRAAAAQEVDRLGRVVAEQRAKAAAEEARRQAALQAAARPASPAAPLAARTPGAPVSPATAAATPAAATGGVLRPATGCARCRAPTPSPTTGAPPAAAAPATRAPTSSRRGGRPSWPTSAARSGATTTASVASPTT